MDKVSIADIRKKLGLNQAQFAQLFGIHQMTISRWERGELAPTPYHEAMLTEFKIAAEKEITKNTLTKLMIGAGIIAAIYFLLKTAKEGK